MKARVDALRRLISGYRQRMRLGVPAPEARQLLRLIMEMEAEVERLLKAVQGMKDPRHGRNGDLAGCPFPSRELRPFVRPEWVTSRPSRSPSALSASGIKRSLRCGNRTLGPECPFYYHRSFSGRTGHGGVSPLQARAYLSVEGLCRAISGMPRPLS